MSDGMITIQNKEYMELIETKTKYEVLIKFIAKGTYLTEVEKIAEILEEDE